MLKFFTETHSLNTKGESVMTKMKCNKIAALPVFLLLLTGAINAITAQVGWHYIPGQSGHVEYFKQVEPHPDRGREANWGWGIDYQHDDQSEAYYNYIHYAMPTKNNMVVDKVKIKFFSERSFYISRIQIYNGLRLVKTSWVWWCGNSTEVTKQISFHPLVFTQGMGITLATYSPYDDRRIVIEEIGVNVLSN